MRQREDRDRELLEGGAINAKQLGDLQHELETLERRQASLEDSLLEVMERREELQAISSPANSARSTTLQSELSEAQRARDDALAGIDQSRRPSAVAARRTDRRSESPTWCRSTSVSGPAVARAPARCRAVGAERAGSRSTAGRSRRIAAAADDEVLRCPECGAILLRVKDQWRVKVIVEADGGSRGNPGPAGYGAVVWTADRETGARREQAGDRHRHQQRRRVPRV